MAAVFLRPKGDKATVRAVTHVRGVGKYLVPSSKRWKDLKHGDLVYCKRCNRGTDTWVVVVNDNKVRELRATGDYFWCTKIDDAVTRHIEDPLDFYRAVVGRKVYQSVTVVGLDTAVHDNIIKAASGGRAVERSKFVWWASYNNYDDLEISASRDYPCSQSVSLDRATPDAYFAGSP